MSKRAYNFNAGPAALPLEVLQQAQEELVDYRGIGMSLMEISHRSKEYEAVNAETQQLLKDLLGIPEGYKVLFLQGGASTQFAMIPLNFLSEGKVGAYVHTGSWAEKAIKEAELIGQTAIAAETKPGTLSIPALSEIQIPENAAYLHITSNETIAGTQYQEYPDTGSVPLIADMSSDILSHPFDVSKFGLIYAGAQKNLGPSGVTVVIIREDLLEKANKKLPTMLRYSVHAKNDSLYNTPPAYSVYIVNLVLKWLTKLGGLEAVAKLNKEKTDLLYDVFDNSGGFYEGLAEKGSRSTMNVTWKLKDEELEKKFIQEFPSQGFIGLKGHRSVGHLRASTYNAVPYEACKALADFLKDFQQRNG
ncbi:3-phosphoserine/phosphohydroxythreonine transaminase [Gorillibacterium sp. CAU 1737]|uniref:3-phosphoserine/phosphohydroxythreonine transaminase n=1 Tax=Gorillibacterium sp. CAU 1737 TaxID=3140362 RepID=UPI003261B510